jgi:hypothetical protein
VHAPGGHHRLGVVQDQVFIRQEPAVRCFRRRSGPLVEVRARAAGMSIGKAAKSGHGGSLLLVNVGRVSSAALMLSGLAGVVMPERVGATLELVPSSARGVTEMRAGLGGTYTALGAWGLFSREPAADVAVGVTWLGAGGVRLASLLADRPRANAAFWTYLVLELGLGVTSLMSASLRRQEKEIQPDDPGTLFRDLQPEG